MKRDVREQARLLRQQGIAVRDIAKQLGVSRGSVSIWVRDIQLTDDQLQALKAHQHRYGAQNAGAQSNRSKSRERRILFQEAGRIKAREKSTLHMMACMLYWAEGAKNRNSVIFVNSDPNMMLLFVRFLREELHVTDTEMIVFLHCHTTDEVEKRRLEQYWLAWLQLPESCLRKTMTKKGSDARKNILVNGVCTVRVYSTELTQHIYGAIQEYGGFDNPAWLF